MKRIAKGDQNALEALYRDYYPRLCRFVLRVTRDVELVKEIVNDVFFVVWRSARDFRGDSTVSTWILGIAYRRALKSASRALKGADRALNSASRQHPTPLPDYPEPAPEETPHRELDLDGSLARLSREQRATVELAYYFGYSYREIAEIMKCPENTVKTRMFHARRTLKSLLET